MKIGGMEGAWGCTNVQGGVQRGPEIGRGIQRCRSMHKCVEGCVEV